MQMLTHKYTVQVPARLGIFSHDETRMIGGRREKERQKERGRAHEKATHFLFFVFTLTIKWPDFCTRDQTKRYRTGSCTLYNLAFLHMTVLCCLQSPPLLRQIYTYINGGREERKRGKAYYKTLFLNYSFHLFKHWQHLSIKLYIRFSHENRPPFWRQIVLYCFHTLNLNTVQFTINLYIFI